MSDREGKMKILQLKDLIGKTMISVKNNNNREIIFKTDDGKRYKLFHDLD